MQRYNQPPSAESGYSNFLICHGMNKRKVSIYNVALQHILNWFLFEYAFIVDSGGAMGGFV